MDFKKIIKDNINYYMELNNKKQIDLSNDLNLTQSVVSSWCSGYRTPTLANLDMLSKYFNINIIDFFVTDKTNIHDIVSIISELDDPYREIIKEQAKTLLNMQNKIVK